MPDYLHQDTLDLRRSQIQCVFAPSDCNSSYTSLLIFGELYRIVKNIFDFTKEKLKDLNGFYLENVSSP